MNFYFGHLILQLSANILEKRIITAIYLCWNSVGTHRASFRLVSGRSNGTKILKGATKNCEFEASLKGQKLKSLEVWYKISSSKIHSKHNPINFNSERLKLSVLYSHLFIATFADTKMLKMKSIKFSNYINE